MKYIFFILSVPLFLFYLLLCFFVPIIKFGKKQRVKSGKVFYVIKDNIHSDYLFISKELNIFKTEKKYTMVGWGDRKIFLETQNWSDLKLENFLKAFYGLNKTVLRVEFTNNIPKNKIVKEYKVESLNDLAEHIKNSFINNKIKKRKEYYQKGDFYESNLRYNCFTNCNNWVNIGLRKCKLSNRLWCPLSFWI